jgi:type II secretory pathway pseudopilin PulG
MEMMVVIAIIGLITAVSAPSVSAGLDSVRIASASSAVASFLNSAANRAQRHQQAVEIVIAPKANHLMMYGDGPSIERELLMPEGIQLDGTVPPGEDEPDGVRRLILLPGASAPGIGIQLSNRHGARRIVRLDPMTGFPRVENVQQQ